jgi:hypothetical protein
MHRLLSLQLLLMHQLLSLLLPPLHRLLSLLLLLQLPPKLQLLQLPMVI